MTASTETLDISIVVPVFGSADTLHELHNRISVVMRLEELRFEVIFVDDCGPGESNSVLRKILQDSQDVVIVEMLRNVGQASATVHGIAQSSGRLIVTMDDDLQQWPEDIPKLLNELRSRNLDLVVARFPTKQQSRFRNVSSEIARRIATTSLPVGKDTHFSSFRVMRRSVFDNYFRDKSFSHVPPGWMYVTAPLNAEVEVRHSERRHGSSTYTFSSLLRSTRPLLSGLVEIGLRVLVVTSLVQIFAAVVGSAIVLTQYANGNIKSPGYTTIVLLLLGILGILGTGVGFLAQYLRTIKRLILNQPNSFVRAVHRSR